MEYRKKKILLNLEKALKKSKQLKDTSDIEKVLNNYNSDQFDCVWNRNQKKIKLSAY